ncbi:Acid protease [Mycena sanguinolenta]|uniref:Acid protease n=1 Tax=Mycena sanguinolenta TaxID=230812 RepID=A0A8H7CUA3_9AGAR|nr:Acid protease [Mycena sanguinolenta]
MQLILQLVLLIGAGAFTLEAKPLPLPLNSLIKPTTLSLTSRKPQDGASVSRHRRRHISRSLKRKRGISPANIPLEDNFLGTDLEWFGSIQGKFHPAPSENDFTVVFDTGSDELLIPGTNCTDSCQRQNKFDPSKSSTFTPDTVDGIFTESFITGGDASPYGLKDWSVTVVQGSDTMTAGGLTVSNVSFLIIQNQSQPFSEDPYDGILGLSTDSSETSFFQGLISQGLPPIYGFFLSPHSIGNAELTLGGVDPSKFTSQTTFAPLVADGAGAWITNCSGIAVNGQTSPALAVDTEVLFDTGTTNVFLPLLMAEALYALISPAIQPNPAEAGAWGIPCSLVASLPASVDFTLRSSDGIPFNVTIPSSELNLGPFDGNSSLCQTVFNSWPGYFTIPPIIGGSLFKHYYTTWDSGNLQIGFVPVSW